MNTLSIVVIAKNEGENLAACLATATWADEVLVIDGGSTDNTVEVAQRFTPHVFSFNDWPGYGKQRQRAQALAHSHWILMLDADEHITPESQREIQEIVRHYPMDTVFAIPRLTWCFGGYIRHGGWYPDYVSRLYPTKLTQYDNALVHEQVIIPPNARVERLTHTLLHFSYRDMQHYLVKSAGYASLWATQKQAQGKTTSLSNGALHAIGCLLRMYILRGGFLDGKRGLLLALLSAHSTFVKYADLWSRSQTKPPLH